MPAESRGAYIARTTGEDTQLLFYAGTFSDATFVEHYSRICGREMTGLEDAYLAFTTTLRTAVARGVMGGVGPACLNCEAMRPRPRVGAGQVRQCLQKCSWCKWAHYCSTECQLEHWRPSVLNDRGHRADFDLIAMVNDRVRQHQGGALAGASGALGERRRVALHLGRVAARARHHIRMGARG